MPLSGAERQRRYLQRLRDSNPEKLQEIKIKNLEQTKRKYRKANELNESERNLQREKWRKQKKDKSNKEIFKDLQKDIEEKEKRLFRYQMRKENSKLKSTIELLLLKVQSQKKSIYRYKKQINHLKDIIKKIQKPAPETENEDIMQENIQTPESKTENIIQEIQIASPDKNIVKKILFENIIIKNSLSKQYSETKNNTERKIFKKIVNNDVISKYKMKTKLSTILGLKGRIRSRKLQKDRKIRRLRELNDFLSRDDNSRASAGKQEYRTIHKKREQVRYLLDTMKNLHMKYKSEGGKLSYTMFTRYKPFYILSPKLSDRNTCACVKHANLNFMAKKLKQLSVINTDNLTQLVSTIACDINNPECMYGECNVCSKKSVSYELLHRNLKDKVTWKRWITKKYEYDNKITKRTVKEEVTQTLETLLLTFCEQMLLFKKHYFNITHQYRMYKYCKDNLTEQEILLHCDFSENYTCKLAEEVQALHFGASKQQISLHTGVFYAKFEGNLQTTSFCTISPNTNHSPGAIWAHLTPILQLINEKYPKVTVMHFYSDGPTTQYRQKKNFYMLNKMMSLYGFERATWSFFEASHGKGAADGIGGATKRNLDRYVTHGQDIPDAKAAYNALVESDSSKIKFFFVSNEDVNAFVKDIDTAVKDLIPVPNTISIHQVVSMPNTDTIKYRKLSCFCGTMSGYCACFDIKEHNLKHKNNINQKKRKTEAKIPKTIKRRRFEGSSSDTEHECEISYAESDDSSWKNESLYEYEFEDSEIIDENTIERKAKENKVAIINESEKLVECIDRKVTILSDIRDKPENKRFFDLTKYGPFTLKPININSQINNDIYNNPTPSTSGINNKNNMEKETFKKPNLKPRESNIIKVDIVEAIMEEKENTIQNTITEIKTKSCGNTDKKVNNSQKQIKEQAKSSDLIYSINDSVLVRYYEKKKWVYYIGFIEDKEMKIDEIYYKIRFLKTVKKPYLKFIITKKIDVDVVPAICIVKIINLKPVSNEFQLTNDADHVYF